MSSNLIKLQAWSKSEHQEGGSRDWAQGIRPTAALKATSRVSAIAPPSTPTNTNMSTPIPIPGPSNKRKRPPAGSKDEREELGGPDPEDLEIAPPSAPALRVPTRGEEFGAT